MQITDAAKEILIEKGYDEKYGARPLRRVIQNLIEDRLAEEILVGNIQKGMDVRIDAKDGAIEFCPEPAKEAE